MPLLESKIVNIYFHFVKRADQKYFFKSSEGFEAALITDNQKNNYSVMFQHKSGPSADYFHT